MKKRIRIQGALIFLSVLLFIVFFRYVMPSWKNEPLDEFFDLCGLAFLYFGFLLRIVSRGYKEDVSRGGNKLVTDGPYSIVRNPMYLGTLLIGAGVVMILFNFWAFIVFMAVYLVIYVPQSKKEEKVLTEKFGLEYRNYCASTPKYLPRFSALLRLGSLVSSLKFSWVKKEASSFIFTFVIICGIEILRDTALFGSGETLDELAEFGLTLLVFVIATIVMVTVKQACSKK